MREILVNCRHTVFRGFDAWLRFFDAAGDVMDIMRKLLWHTIVQPGQIFHLARVQVDETYDTPLHTHDFAEVFWVETGTGLHRVNQVEVELAAGHLVMIRPDDVHGFGSTNTHGFTLVNLAFDATTREFLQQRYGFGSSWFWSQETMPHSVQLNKDQLTWLKRCVDELASASNQRLGLERFLLNLLHEVAQQSQLNLGVPCDECPDWIRQLLAYMQQPQHFSQGAKHAAQLVNRAPEHVTRELKRHAGLTTSELMAQARMNYASAQLRITTNEISKIALACGYDSLSRFYEVFRARFGLTPREYRLQHQAVLR